VKENKDKEVGRCAQIIKNHRIGNRMLLRNAAEISGYEIHRWSRWERGLEIPKDPLVLRNIADTLSLNGDERLRLYETAAQDQKLRERESYPMRPLSPATSGNGENQPNI
jgi:hypothetical protein